jgi:hypothetical protein
MLVSPLLMTAVKPKTEDRAMNKNPLPFPF